MARLIRKKCARSLIVVKAVVLISVGPVKVGPVPVVVKTHADEVKAGQVLATVKTHVDPAKAIEISLALNAMMPKVC